MPPQIYPLNVDVAAELRDELSVLDAGSEWRVTRLCEQAQAAGYQAGYTRGRVDGRHRATVEHTCPDAPPHVEVDRETLLDVLAVVDADWNQQTGKPKATPGYIQHLADRLIAADAITGTP